MKSALELMRESLLAIFAEKNIEKALSFLSKDVHCFGLAGDRTVSSLEEANELLTGHDHSKIMSFDISMSDEKVIFSDEAQTIATLGFTLSCRDISISYREIGLARVYDGVPLLCLLQFSLLTEIHAPDMLYKLQNEKRKAAQQALFESAIPGGIMVCAFEKDYPLHFINSQMLDYLGYPDEDSFKKAIGGLVINCIHPEDREYVSSESDRMLSEHGECSLEYRLQKKDGSYSWIHDTSRIYTELDGKRFVNCFFYDITKEKEHTLLIENLVNTLNGGIVLYEVHKDSSLTPFFVSAGVGEISSRTNDEYLELCEKDVFDSVFEADREFVRNAFMQAVNNDKVTSLTYRVPDKNAGFVWINGTFSRFGERNGFPVLRAVFSPVSLQHDLQIQALDQNTTGIYIVDAQTEELYYANDTSFKLHDKEPCDIAGKKCYDVFFSGSSHCKFCWKDMSPGNKGTYETYVAEKAKTLSLTAQKKSWNGRSVYVVYTKDITEQKASEQLLRQREEMLELACGFADLYFWSVDIDNNIAYCPKALQDAFKVPEVLENYPDSWLERNIILPEYESAYRNAVEEIKNGGQSALFECKIHLPDGSDVWSRCRMNRLSGNAGIAICTAQSIDGERSLKAQIERERRKQLGGDKSLLRYYVTNLSKNLVMEYRELHGEGPITRTGISFEDAIALAEPTVAFEEDRIKYHEMHVMENILSGYEKGITTYSIEFHRKKKDGSIVWERNVQNLLRDPENGDLFLYEYCYDIQQHKMLEETLNAAVNYDYERFGSVQLLSGQITMLYNRRERPEMTISTHNYSGVSTEYGKKHVLPEDREMFLKCISLDEVRRMLCESDTYEFVHRTLEDGNIHFKRTRFAMYDVQNQIVLMTRTDITELVCREEEKNKGLQEALEIAEQATQAKTDFLSRMSHEIRTPMNAIMGMTAIAKENKADYNEVSECLDKIDMSSHYLLNLINDILEMSRIESGRTEISHTEFDFGFLMESIRTIIEPLAVKRGVRYEFINRAKVDSHYLGDMMRIQQVIVNLLSNAVKFTKSGGKVRFTVDITNLTESRAVFCFSVADTGVGMSEEFMTRMFEPFTQEDSGTTSEYSGSGLGLAISKNLIEAMGGKISAESFIGVGTTFKAELALERLKDHTETPYKAKPQQKTSDFSILKGCHVLLAEDHPLNVRVATKLLERAGISVDVAENGKVAVEKFQSSKEHYYSAILMDIRMPVMDGLDATSTIRKLARADSKTVPIIAMTANALDEDRKKSSSCGMTHHLAKPYEPAQLYQVLTDCITEA